MSGWQSGGGSGGGLSESEVETIVKGHTDWLNLDDFVSNRADAADGFDAAIAACIADNKRLYVPPGEFIFDRVAAAIPAYVEIAGQHLSRSVLTYSPTTPAASGFLRIVQNNGLGTTIRDLSILTTDESETPVHAIWIQPGSHPCGHIHLEDLNITFKNTTAQRWEIGLNAVGTTNPNAPAGVRSLWCKNIVIHDNCDTANVSLFGVKGAHFSGGQFFGDFNISSDGTTISENIWIVSEIQGNFSDAGGSLTSNINRVTA